MRFARLVAIALLGAWTASRTIRVSDAAIFAPVPLLGQLRIDLAAPLLLLQMGAVLALRARTLVLVTVFGLFMPHLVAPPALWNRGHRLSGYSVAIGHGANVTTHESVLSEAECERIVAAAWAVRHLWTKYTVSGPVGYFGLGQSRNFDAKARSA